MSITYNKAKDLKSESKTRKKKKNISSDGEDDSSEESSDQESNKIQALQKDMLRMMKEFKNMKTNPSRSTEGGLWCTDCKEEGHTKGSCPKISSTTFAKQPSIPLMNVRSTWKLEATNKF